VLVGDAQGRPRYDFTGRLPFAWPASAAPARAAAAQFALGYGLGYGEHRTLAPLPEESGVREGEANFANYFVHGRPLAPWALLLRQSPQAAAEAPHGGRGGSGANLSLRAVDADGLQEGGRQFHWRGEAESTVQIAGPPLDMRMLSNGEAALVLRLRVDEAASAPVSLGVGCGSACGAHLDLTPALAAAPAGQWQSLKIKLACFRAAGADVAHIEVPFALTTTGHLRLSIADVQLSSDPSGAICPTPAPASR